MARHNEREYTKVYQEYVCENLRIIGENTSKLGGGSYLTLKFHDLVDPKKPEQDERTGDEIVADVIEKCGLKVVRENKRL